ncbi:MAG: lipoyl synthase [Holosporales bacterium]|jgi:lipoic acid synthetase|nr:lipoyl synthase [Holosporales bacterium]
MALEKPKWLKARSTCCPGYYETLKIVKSRGIHTVCEEDCCPNIGECWRNKTATFLIMGNICTRKCGFCNIKTGCPSSLDLDEPRKVADSIFELGLKYAVITSVTRDDLEDNGAQHFASVITAIKNKNPGIKVEILTPDFQGNQDAIKIICKSKPEVFGHNIEIIRRLHEIVKRKPGDYDVSLNFLKDIKKLYPNMITKTGMLVGVGESKEEVLEIIDDIKNADVNIMTIGQYMAPSTAHYPIARYVSLEEFAEYKEYGERRGIKIISAPLVRSSYDAAKIFDALCSGNI